MTTTIIHKSELKTSATLRSPWNSPLAQSLVEHALFYANRGQPGDGRLCRQYRRLYSIQKAKDLA